MGKTAVHAATRGQSVLDLSVAGPVLHDLLHSQGRLPGNEIAERGMEVLRLLTNGRTNKKIAAALSIGEEMIKTHVGNILAKLQLAHLTQAVIYALKEGLISLEELG